MLVPGPIPVKVPADLSSHLADDQPAYPSQVGSPYATPDQRRSPSGRSTAISRHSPATDDRGDRTTNRTMVAQSRRVSSPELERMTRKQTELKSLPAMLSSTDELKSRPVELAFPPIELPELLQRLIPERHEDRFRTHWTRTHWFRTRRPRTHRFRTHKFETQTLLRL